MTKVNASHDDNVLIEPCLVENWAKNLYFLVAFIFAICILWHTEQHAQDAFNRPVIQAS